MFSVCWVGATPDFKIVASELKDPICHSDECQIGSFSSEATDEMHEKDRDWMPKKHFNIPIFLKRQ